MLISSPMDAVNDPRDKRVGVLDESGQDSPATLKSNDDKDWVPARQRKRKAKDEGKGMNAPLISLQLFLRDARIQVVQSRIRPVLISPGNLHAASSGIRKLSLRKGNLIHFCRAQRHHPPLRFM